MPPAPPDFTIRPLLAAEWPTWRALRLRSLADSAHAFGATLADEARRPDETWAARLAAARASGRDLPLVAELDGRAVGLCWAKLDGDDATVVNLFQVWVAPEARGRGLAQALLSEAARWAGALGATAMHLGVACGADGEESAAQRLYRRAGFVDHGAPQPLRAGSRLMSQPMRLALPIR